MPGPKILIAGGSIGGLTAGLLLADLGFDVEIFERSSAALQERGTGIVVLPITERYFAERGGDAERPSLELTYWSYIDSTGTITHADPDHFRFSGWNTVYRAMMDVFDADRYHLDSEMVGFDQRADGVTLHLADGRSVEGDLLVCSDGIASTARRILLPEVEPTYSGYVAWRGVTEERFLSPSTLETVRDAMVYQVLDHSHILVYAIPDHEGDTTPGARIINSVWYRNYPDDGTFEALMTDRDGNRRTTTMPPGTISSRFVDEMLSTARSTLAPPLREIVEKCPGPLVQAIYDLEVDQMAFGRVIIMGDAAFGLRPHVAAGQAKACADAWALRDAMAGTGGDIESALAIWEPQQLALGRMAVDRTRRMGIRSQFEGSMFPGDPTWKFGLWEPGN
ncbi:MAG: monooxygenase [Acidimicrobiia bacterium]|nr:monooxygenase [Acidimicrobiia bacterium]MDH4306435.1 monooxygenase [Acidimicrobiia bacterium]MDH5292648.1 monooxygenase [Acidimicrobiia bacterium]